MLGSQDVSDFVNSCASSWEGKLAKSQRILSGKRKTDQLKQDTHSLLKHFQKRDLEHREARPAVSKILVIPKPAPTQDRQRTRLWPLPTDKAALPPDDDDDINPIARAVLVHVSDKYVVSSRARMPVYKYVFQMV
jgi:hypothetical protein